MERRLLKAIMTPAMIASFVFGIWMLVLNPELLSEVWFHIKATAVLVMAGIHGKFSKMQRLLENDTPPLSDKAYRIWNEVPTVLMIVIIVMAVAKPL
jgi:putative membrane protein